MPFSNEIRAGASGAQSTSLFNEVTSRSLRFERGDSSYLTFTHGTATDISKWTVNFWFKTEYHTSSYADDYITLWGVEGPGTTSFSFIDGDLHFYLNYNSGGSQIVLRSNRKFRDPAAWYNFHVKFDRAQGTAANRLKIFVNGVDLDNEGGYSTDERSNIASDSSSGWNVSGTVGGIGRRSGATDSRYVSGTLAYFHNIDGQYLDATDFIEIKEGICVPKLYSGSYGNNGWKLEFLQTGTGTASSSTIGADTSGNNNHWTSNNLASTDIMLDHPENNFAVLNSLFAGNSAVLKQGNLEVEPGGFSSSLYGTVSTFSIPKDKKIYIEVECTDQDGTYWTAGFATTTSLENGPSSNNVGSSGSIMSYNRSVFINGTENDYGSSSGLGGLGVAKFSAGDILGCAIDGATGKVWFSRNGTYFGEPQGAHSGAGTTGNPSAGTNEIGTLTGGTTDDVFFVVSGHANANEVFVNFGQDSVNIASANTDANGIGTFEYAPPTDYVCLCAANLTTPDIGPTQSQQADDHFDTVLFSGTGSNQTVTGFNFQPDFVWNKTRNQSRHHTLNDSVRGGGHLKSSNTDSEGASTISAYNSDGYDWTYNGSNVWYDSSATVVSWAWKGGGTAVSNGNGSTTSSVSANQDAGFSIVSYTGTGSATTVGHGLSSAPEVIITKNRDDSGNWMVYHANIASDAETDYINLNLTNAAADGASVWNDTAPTSSVFSVGTNGNSNGSSDDIIAYCFHSVEGYSKFGSYKGNANADGTFVFTGFRPAWIITKRVDSTSNWLIIDVKRDIDNVAHNRLIANSANTEATSEVATMDILSNGFKRRDTNTDVNASGGTYIYLAFAEAPFKFANAR